jgi:hypothetical protein
MGKIITSAQKESSQIRLGFFQDVDVGVAIFPEGEETRTAATRNREIEIRFINSAQRF